MNDPAGASARQLHRTVWVLGIVSLLMDLSSEIYHALLPAFLTVTLGLPVAAMGALDAATARLGDATQLVGLYDQLDAVGLDGVVENGLGLVAGALCALAVGLKFRFRIDDSLDVVGVHGVGGIVGALLTGVFASTAINSLGADGSLAQVGNATNVVIPGNLTINGGTQGTGSTVTMLLNAGQMLDEEALDAIEAAGVDEDKVRTPLTCATRFGICARCYGRDLGRGYAEAMQRSAFAPGARFKEAAQSKKEDFICPITKSPKTRLRISSAIFWHRIACM